MRQARPVAAGMVLAVTVGWAPAAGGQASVDSRSSPPGLVVVLQDLSPPSQQLRFQTSRAVARREDGQVVALSVLPRPAATGEPSAPVEILWLEGDLPPGGYQGIEVAFVPAEAATAPSGGKIEIPSEPAQVNVPFVVRPGSGTVLAVSLRSTQAQDAPGRLEPVFEGRVRSRPTTGLIGLASIRSWESVTLFDKRSGALASLLHVGRDPASVAVDPERVRAYVAVSGEDAVAVLDLLEGRVLERVTLRAGDAPRDLALTPDGRTLVVANPGSDTVSFVDALSATEIERAAVAGRPSFLLMDRDGRRVLVLAERSSSIAVLSVSARSAVGAVAVESGPVQARFSGRTSERILVVHAESPYMTVVDSRTLNVEQRVYVGPGARALEVDARSGRIYLARAKVKLIEVFDPSSFLPIAEIPVPGEVAWLAVEPENNGLGVLLREPAEVRMVGLVGGSTVTRTPLGPGPAALEFLQGGSAP